MLVGVWPGTARRLQPEQGGGEGLVGGTAAAPVEPCLAPGWARVQGQARARLGRLSVEVAAQHMHTGTGEGETKVPNELVKHLYNFSSFYKEGLLYTIYTWR